MSEAQAPEPSTTVWWVVVLSSAMGGLVGYTLGGLWLSHSSAFVAGAISGGCALGGALIGNSLLEAVVYAAIASATIAIVPKGHLVCVAVIPFLAGASTGQLCWGIWRAVHGGY